MSIFWNHTVIQFTEINDVFEKYSRHTILNKYGHIALICDDSVTTQNLWFYQEILLKFLKCYNFLWVQQRHNCSPAASFWRLRYDTIPVKSASANVSFYTNNWIMPKFELWHSCCKWAICLRRESNRTSKVHLSTPSSSTQKNIDIFNA